MAIKHKTRVKEIASNKPNASTAFNLPGSAATGFRTFAAAYSNTDQLPYHATNGTDWESGIGTFTTGSPNTIVRTTILESSNSDAAVDFSAGADVELFVEWPAKMGERAFSSGYIRGLALKYSSGTALVIEAGTVVIDNKAFTLAQTTITSGTTMKNLSGATVTIGASKAYFVYAYDNAGTLEIRVQEFTGSGDGDAPTFDQELDYFKGSVAGSRRIGKIITNASSQIIIFKSHVYGRTRHLQLATSGGAIALVAYGAATTYTAITTTPFVTPDDATYYAEYQVRRDSSTGSAQLLLSSDGGVAEISNLNFGASILPAASSFGAFIIKIPNTGTLHYRVSASNSGYIRYLGSEFFV